jgi:hypothetical protein
MRGDVGAEKEDALREEQVKELKQKIGDLFLHPFRTGRHISPAQSRRQSRSPCCPFGRQLPHGLPHSPR